MVYAEVSPQAASGKGWITRRQSTLEAGLLLLLTIVLLWRGLIPGWRQLNTDFANYYVAARLIRERYCLDRIYDWIWFQRAADHFGISHQLAGFLGLTPFSALPILPFSWLSVMKAKRLWIVCNVVLLAVSVELLGRQTALSRRRAWIIALCAVIPLESSFLFGQMHILVLTLLVAAYVAHMRDRQISSGCYIALAAALKIYPIFFCLYFLVKKRWTALGAVITCAALCTAVSYMIMGSTAMNAYVFQQLPRSLQGESGNPFLASLTSSSAMFHRLFLYDPEVNPHPLMVSPRLYAITYPLWQAALVGVVFMRMRSGVRADRRESLEWSMFLCLLMFLSSAPASYQFVVLIAAAVPTIAILVGQWRWKIVLAYLSLYFLACNIKAIHLNRPEVSVLTPLCYLTLWSGVALLILYGVLLKTPIVERCRKSNLFFRRPVFKAGVLVLCLWTLGARSAWLHLKDIRINESDAIIPRDGAYLRTDPVSTVDGFQYVAMRQDGYRVLRDDGAGPDVISRREPDGDELSFAASGSGQATWVEVASVSGSRLIDVDSDGRMSAREIDDAEAPALSRDDSVLGFVREDRGRGSLWTINLREGTVPMRITLPAYDVRSVAAGPGGMFLMSAVYQGRERIFTVSPGAIPQLMIGGDEALDSPAISPDGTMLVVRKLMLHRWQLMSFDLSSRGWRQLTHGDCNAYTPSWKDRDTLLYATDCMRGVGLTSLATMRVDR